MVTRHHSTRATEFRQKLSSARYIAGLISIFIYLPRIEFIPRNNISKELHPSDISHIIAACGAIAAVYHRTVLHHL